MNDYFIFQNNMIIIENMKILNMKIQNMKIQKNLMKCL